MWKFLFLLLIVFTSTYAFDENENYNYFVQNIQDMEIVEDALLNAMELIAHYGYIAEDHELKTEDDYYIELHRIPRGRRQNKNDHKTPVLLMHSLLGSSSDWIINGPEKSLGCILADRGYDVWLGNVRGNYYSRNHTFLDPRDDDKFWRFSWNEIGIYDIPKMIEHISVMTGRKKMHYIGHSQGAAAFFIMASEKPEYNDRILSMQALAPTVYTDHAKSPIITFLRKYVDYLEKMYELLGRNEFSPNSEMKKFLIKKFCNEESSLQPLCENFIFNLYGYDLDHLNLTLLPIYMSHTPAVFASEQFIHFIQMHVSKKFRKFDYGEEKNFLTYGSSKPPDYNLTKVSAPVAVHYSESDWIVDPQDIDKMYNELSNPIGSYGVPLTEFNHLDLLLAINAPILVYKRILDVLESYNFDPVLLK